MEARDVGIADGRGLRSGEEVGGAGSTKRSVAVEYLDDELAVGVEFESVTVLEWLADHSQLQITVRESHVRIDGEGRRQHVSRWLLEDLGPVVCDLEAIPA